MSRRVRIRVAVVLLLIVLAVVLPPFVNVSRFRSRIADGISNAIGHRVTIDTVELRLLPEPGFTLGNFVVADDPAISAEPMLRAEEVNANLRLSSLWRGRLEIARLTLSYPSLNLVRGSDGKFNIESLLVRASQTPSAPTTAAHAEARPRFPYIEADGGRINFKTGLEKKVFSFTDAEFALWSPGENEWRMRFEGRPFRSDMPVNDTGTLKMEASFRRAAKLSETPVQIRASLERAQMGQFTKLLYGRDRGWRGGLQLNAQASGKPSDLAIVLDGAVDDFRRYDIYGEDNIRIQTRCTGKLSTVRETITDIACHVPVGDGLVEVRGGITNLFHADYDLSVTANKLPLSAITTIVKHAKKGLPEDLAASGSLDAAITLRREGGVFAAQGGGSTEGFVLNSRVLQKELPLGRLEFAMQREQEEPVGKKRKKVPAVVTSSLPHVEVFPFPIQMGGSLPVAASAKIARDGYEVDARGDADVQRLLQVGRALGIPSPWLAATGTAKIDMKVAGQWEGFGVPTPTGTLQLRSVRLELPGIGAPVELRSAVAKIAPDALGIQNMDAEVGQVRIAGALNVPLTCEEAAQPCPTTFDLHADHLDTDQLNTLINPRTRKRPWYRLLSSRDAEDSVLVRLRALGKLTADKFAARSLIGTRASANLELKDSVAEFTNIRAEVFGGTQTGALTADFSGDRPKYQGSGSIARAAMAQVATAMKDGWATGTLNAKYEFAMEGWTAAELFASAKAAADFQWNDGVLRHVTLGKHEESLRFSAYTGRAVFERGTLAIQGSKLQTPGGIYEVSGTAQPDRKVEFTLVEKSGLGYKITGSLENPQVAALPEKQASAPLNQ